MDFKRFSPKNLKKDFDHLRGEAKKDVKKIAKDPKGALEETVENAKKPENQKKIAGAAAGAAVGVALGGAVVPVIALTVAEEYVADKLAQKKDAKAKKDDKNPPKKDGPKPQ